MLLCHISKIIKNLEEEPKKINQQLF